MTDRAALALEQTGRKVLVAAGGVARQLHHPRRPAKAVRKAWREAVSPPLKWCGDNGAMIGAQGYYEYMAGVRGDMTLNGYATMELDKVVF